jgi:hypothetical protein
MNRHICIWFCFARNRWIGTELLVTPYVSAQVTVCLLILQESDLKSRHSSLHRNDRPMVFVTQTGNKNCIRSYNAQKFACMSFTLV